MAIFGSRTKATIQAVPESEGHIAAAASGYYTGNAGNIGANSVGNYYSYSEGVLRNNAMSVPTIARARDLIASVISSTPLQMYKEAWDEQEQEMVKTYLAPRSWLAQPDPAIPYNTLMAWTLDDLFFFGKATWFIQSRTSDGFPNSFTRLPASMVTYRDQAGPVFFAPSNEVYFQGGRIDPENLVQFISPIQGIVYQSETSVQTAIRLEKARFRNATSTIPAGTLKITGGEPLTDVEMQQLGAAFNAARENNQTAVISQDLDYIETKANPANMMLMEAANFQALEMCRITNIPPFLAGVDVGSYQYQNGKDAREQLYLFAARAYMDCIAQTLSMNNILPVGTKCEFDIDDYLSEVIGAEADDLEEMMDANNMPSMGSEGEPA
ncbi:MAG: phage portal protein [Fluviibacter sp.]